MMFGEIDYLAARERHGELLRQAKQDRLVRLAKSTQINRCCTDGIEKTCG